MFVEFKFRKPKIRRRHILDAKDRPFRSETGLAPDGNFCDLCWIQVEDSGAGPGNCNLKSI